MKERIMELGERRRVTLVLWMEDGASFEPVQPTWELSKAQETPETGTCEAVPDGARWQPAGEPWGLPPDLSVRPGDGDHPAEHPHPGGVR